MEMMSTEKGNLRGEAGLGTKIIDCGVQETPPRHPMSRQCWKKSLEIQIWESVPELFAGCRLRPCPSTGGTW